MESERLWCLRRSSYPSPWRQRKGLPGISKARRQRSWKERDHRHRSRRRKGGKAAARVAPSQRGGQRQRSKGHVGDIVFVIITVVFLTTQRKRRTTTKMVRTTIVCSRSPSTTAAVAAREQQRKGRRRRRTRTVQLSGGRLGHQGGRHFVIAVRIGRPAPPCGEGDDDAVLLQLFPLRRRQRTTERTRKATTATTKNGSGKGNGNNEDT